jgi:hypothetical protein
MTGTEELWRRAGMSEQEVFKRFVEILTEEGLLKMDDGNMDEMAEALGYAREWACFGTLSHMSVAALREGRRGGPALEWHDRTLRAIALLDKSINGLEARHILRFWGKA